MAKERELWKDRVCRECGVTLHTSALGLKKHAVVCGFEKRTGLTVVMENEGIVVR